MEVQGRHATRSGWFGRVSSVWTGADSASRKTGASSPKPSSARAGSPPPEQPGLRTRSAGTPAVDVLPDISGAIAPVADMDNDMDNDMEAANLEGSQPSRLSDVGRELTARGQKKLSDGGGGGAGGGAPGGRKQSVESRLTAGKKKKSVMFASPCGAERTAIHDGPCVDLSSR